MPTIKLLKRAEIELFHSCDWYEEKSKGLSLKFRLKFSLLLKSIVKNPLLFPIRSGENLRFAPMKGFPFVVIYWLDENLDTIFVVSVFHTSRKPRNIDV